MLTVEHLCLDFDGLKAVNDVSLHVEKGSVTALMKNMGSLSPEEKKTFGKEVNELKDYATEAIAQKFEALQQLQLPESLTRLDTGAFYGCTALSGSLTIPGSVTAIGDYAFYGCARLERVVMPTDLENIGEHAFSGCSACLEYDFTKCQGIPYFDETAFEGMNENAKIYVSGEQYSSWIRTARWYPYKDRIEAVGDVSAELGENEGLTYTYNGTGYTLTGLGSCEDVVVVVPAIYNDGVNGEAAVVSVSELHPRQIAHTVSFWLVKRQNRLQCECFQFAPSPNH